MKENKILTRRDFLKGTVTTTLSLTMGFPARIEAAASRKAKVVLIRDPDVFDRTGRINAEGVQKMLDRAVTALLGKEDPVDSWKLLVKPADIVGVKSNEWGPLPTPKEVESALIRRIRDAGVDGKNIGIDDRGVLANPIFRNSTALINVRPLRTHHWAGIGGCLKNYIMFTEEPSDYHPDSCANLAAIWKLPAVKGKTRLNILVLFTPLFHGIGPHHFDMEYTWPYKGILVGADPVAVDAVGLRILELKRQQYFGKSMPLRPPAKHVAIAADRHKLGIGNLGEIELVKKGWTENALI